MIQVWNYLLIISDDADDVVRVAVDEKVVIQQVHLQNGLVLAHGLDGHALGTHHLELGLFADVKLRGNGGSQSLLAQALAEAGLVLADLAVNGGAGGVDRAAHIAVSGILLGAEESAAAADGDFNHAAMSLFH